MKKIFAFLTALICCLSMWSFVPAAQSLTLDKEDGEYSIQVDLEGGSGKASVTTPTLITVKDGSVTAKIQWSSSNYDYMIVDGEKYLPVNEEGSNSEFEIPVTALDEGMPVIADTTAMPSAPLPFKISRLERFRPPMATTGIGTALQIADNVETSVSTVVTLVVVG